MLYCYSLILYFSHDVELLPMSIFVQVLGRSVYFGSLPAVKLLFYLFCSLIRYTHTDQITNTFGSVSCFFFFFETGSHIA